MAAVTFELLDCAYQEAISKRGIAQQENIVLLSCSRNAIVKLFGAPK